MPIRISELRNHSSESIETTMRELCALAISGDLAGVKQLLQERGRVDGFDVDGFSQDFQSNPLQLAAQFGHVPVLETLLHAGANGNFAQFGTPLLRAIQNGHYAVVQKLLEHRVDVNYVDASQSSALAKAAEIGEVRYVELLLMHGAELRPPVGDSPFLKACRGQQTTVLAMLLDRDPTLLNELAYDWGVPFTPLDFSVIYQCIDSVQFLLARGADANVRYANEESRPFQRSPLSSTFFGIPPDCSVNFSLVALLTKHSSARTINGLLQSLVANCTGSELRSELAQVVMTILCQGISELDFSDLDQDKLKPFMQAVCSALLTAECTEGFDFSSAFNIGEDVFSRNPCFSKLMRTLFCDNSIDVAACVQGSEGVDVDQACAVALRWSVLFGHSQAVDALLNYGVSRYAISVAADYAEQANQRTCLAQLERGLSCRPRLS